MTTEARQEKPCFEAGTYTFRINVSRGTDDWQLFKRAMREALEMQVGAVIAAARRASGAEAMSEAERETGHTPERIYLEPAPGSPDGRMWCEDPVWNSESIAFVRADLVGELVEAADEAEIYLSAIARDEFSREVHTRLRTALQRVRKAAE